jgi:hypothetical protein
MQTVAMTGELPGCPRPPLIVLMQVAGQPHTPALSWTRKEWQSQAQGCAKNLAKVVSLYWSTETALLAGMAALLQYRHAISNGVQRGPPLRVCERGWRARPHEVPWPEDSL